ncbi:MAG: hypothetical protein MjAS7_2500 [Metallosphaera javensis (ex Sakai et al. 2022)]|nr:MAG: hypothetical protein MjAS7_2500 [Metallosphaera javensis (ex Sakai et al. 2022)]
MLDTLGSFNVKYITNQGRPFHKLLSSISLVHSIIGASHSSQKDVVHIAIFNFYKTLYLSSWRNILLCLYGYNLLIC